MSPSSCTFVNSLQPPLAWPNLIYWQASWAKEKSNAICLSPRPLELRVASCKLHWLCRLQMLLQQQALATRLEAKWAESGHLHEFLPLWSMASFIGLSLSSCVLLQHTQTQTRSTWNQLNVIQSNWICTNTSHIFLAKLKHWPNATYAHTNTTTT